MLNFKQFQMFLTFISIVIFFTILNYSCKNTAVSPPEDTPGRRDYVWTVDTVNYPHNPMFRMWGSSPEDVWTTTTSNWDKSISHYEGNKWISYGVVGLIQPNSIFGFSNNNVFVTAENGQIWRFDGTKWNQFAQLTKDGHSDIVFDNIWGADFKDIFATGAYPDEIGYNNSVIAHFSNNKWEMLNTNDLYGIVEHLYKNPTDDIFYLQLIGGRDYTDSTQIYEYSKGIFVKLYGNIWTKGLQADISLINDEVYFILGSQIAIRANDKFQTVLNVENPNFYQRIWGRNSKDIFLLMTDGLAHYNGSDIEYLFHFNLAEVKPWTQIYGAALFKDDVFFLAYEPPTGLNLIYHGKLK